MEAQNANNRLLSPPPFGALLVNCESPVASTPLPT